VNSDTLLAPELTPVERTEETRRFPTAEAAIAVMTFALFCVAVLTKATKLLEPDDAAYQASILALIHGHITLSTAQYNSLSAQLSAHGGIGIAQWVHLPDGRWISEKNPGYPFFATPFQWLGILRAAPLFAGALASTSLFVAGRRWLGKWGGTWAVIFFLFSGAALAFAWRPTMPSFTDAALVAAGTGALLWTFLADDASPRRRTVIGLLGFLSLEAAVFIRYTDIIILLVAVIAVVVTFRRARIPARSLIWWFSSLALFAGGVMFFDQIFYGGTFRTGYGPGEITFAFSAIIPNLKLMPSYLVKAIPALLLGFAALVWMAVRVIRSRSRATDPVSLTTYRRDGVVGLVLAAGWLGLWGLYSAYTWTAQTGPRSGAGGAIHIIRFYLPAIGLISLLGAWLLTQLPKWLPLAVVIVVAVLGFSSFRNLTAAGAVRFPGGFPGGTRGGAYPPPGGFPKGVKPGTGRPPPGFTPPKGFPAPAVSEDQASF
jgi:hypothetical protein